MEKEITKKKIDYKRLLQAILDICEEMVVAGAEVSRAENSVERMCESYGGTRANAFITMSNIQVTFESPEGEIITQIRRVVRYEADFDKLDYLNDLSRYICANNPDVDEIRQRFDQVMGRKKLSPLMQFLGAILTASGFTVFFGGGWEDALAAAIMGFFIGAIKHFMGGKEKNEIVYCFVVSLVGGVIAVLCVAAGIGVNLDKIMIGGIMLLIPGIALTNAIRDMLIGDTTSGLLRLVNSLLVAAAVACGFALAIITLGGML